MTSDEPDDKDHAGSETDEQTEGGGGLDMDDDGAEDQVYVDRENLDFDPDDGLYTGTVVTGDTEIPGEHEQTDDVEVDESDEDSGSDQD